MNYLGKTKREVVISKKLLIKIAVSFLISFVATFIIQNFGTFSYKSENLTNSKYEYGTDRVLLIKYTSQLGSVVTNYQFKDSYLEYQVKDLLGGGKFNRYENKLRYYLKATLNDFRYVIFLWITLSIIIVAISKVKIKVV